MRLINVFILGSILTIFSLPSFANDSEIFKAKSPSQAQGSFQRTINKIDDQQHQLRLLKRANELIQAQPDNQAYIAGRAQVYRNLGDLKNSLLDINRAIELSPHNRTYLLFRADVYSDSNQLENALADLNRASADGSPKADLLKCKAATLASMKRYREALVECNESIRLNPDYAEAYSVRARVRYYLNDLVGSKKDCAEAIRLNPSDGDMQLFMKDRFQKTEVARPKVDRG